jgi:hypothetical protein
LLLLSLKRLCQVFTLSATKRSSAYASLWSCLSF